MKKVTFIANSLQLVAIFVMLKHLDSAIGLFSYAMQLFRNNSSNEPTFLLYAIVSQLIYFSILFGIIFTAHRIANALILKSEDPYFHLPFDASNFFLFGLVIVLGFFMLNSTSDFLISCFNYFKGKTSPSEDRVYDESQNFYLMYTSLFKMILVIFVFYFRDQILSRLLKFKPMNLDFDFLEEENKEP